MVMTETEPKHLLDILLPTYNRSDKLVKNISLICSQLGILKKESYVKIIIVDNCSSDNTFDAVEGMVAKFPNSRIDLYRNTENVGLYNNIIKALSYASAPFIMYLGDDDFLPMTYWEHVFKLLEGDKDVGFIKPCRREIDSFFDVPTRLDTGDATVKPFKRNMWSTLLLASSCNQLSGLVYRNIDLYARVQREKVLNVYPFMAFAGWVLEKHQGYSIEGSPVLITDGVKKDWGYGQDGTLGDIVDNVKFFLGRPLLKRMIGEAYFANKWKWFLSIVIRKGFYCYFLCLSTLLLDKRLLPSTRLMFIYFCSYIQLRIWIYNAKVWLTRRSNA